ncbi:MAG: MBL fold metallo-hydrolase [Caldilineales bacterium]|nr:MBL fold metallo-hydrolase [Caldilineales bacterium]
MKSDQCMQVQFWGVRGTIPAPGPKTVRYGGNTTCVSIRFDDNKILILDAGTGIRELGKELLKDDEEIFLLLTHYHWDHIQGFPVFGPIYQPGRRVHLLPGMNRSTVFGLLAQMDGIHYPVTPEDLLSDTEFIASGSLDYLRKHGIYVERIETNHPGGSSGYRIERGGRVVVFLTDNELDPPGERTTEYDAFVEFSRDADLLIHDAQYLPEDMPVKWGWGHSVIDHVRELARAANVKHVALTHHDPDRTDDALDRIQADSDAWFADNAPQITCSVAYEGLIFDLPASCGSNFLVAEQEVLLVQGEGLAVV